MNDGNVGYAGTATQLGGSHSGVSAVQPPPPDCIGTHLGDLGHAIESLADEIAGLAQRIDPVLRPNPAGVGAGNGVPTPIRSNVANSIVSNVDKVQQLIRRVRDLRESVDL